MVLFILKERKGHHKEADQAPSLGVRGGDVQTRPNGNKNQDEPRVAGPQGSLNRGTSLPQGSAILTRGKKETGRREKAHAL